MALEHCDSYGHSDSLRLVKRIFCQNRRLVFSIEATATRSIPKRYGNRLEYRIYRQHSYYCKTYILSRTRAYNFTARNHRHCQYNLVYVLFYFPLRSCGLYLIDNTMYFGFRRIYNANTSRLSFYDTVTTSFGLVYLSHCNQLLYLRFKYLNYQCGKKLPSIISNGVEKS